MHTLFVSVAALVAFGAAFRKLTSVVRRRTLTPGSAALCLSLFCVGLASALWTPVLETALPVGVAARLRVAATVVALFCALLTTVYIGHRIACRLATLTRHLLTAAPVLVLLVVLATVLPIAPAGRLDEFDLVAACYTLVATTELALRLAGYARAACRRPAVLGLWTMTVACIATEVYALSVVGTMVAMWVTRTAYPCHAAESPLCGLRLGSAVAGPTLTSLALLLSVLATGDAMLRRSRRDRELCRRLEPLWETLVAAIPEIALTSPTAVHGGPAPWQTDARLYRRWVEIRDALLLLHHYRHREWRCRTPDQEAAAITHALRAHRTGWTVEPGLRPRIRHGLDHSDAYLADVHQLAEVSEALARQQAFLAGPREPSTVR